MKRLRRFAMIGMLGWALGLLWVMQVYSAGLRSVSDGWLLDGGDTARVLAGRGAGKESPATGLGFWVTAGQTRLFGMEELPVVSLALGAGSPSGRWQVGVTWERMGADLLVEDDVMVALQAGRQPRFGVRLRGRRWTIASYQPESHMDPAFEVGWSGEAGLGWWDLTLIWHPLESAPWLGQRGRRPLARMKIVPTGWGLAVALDLDAEGKPHGEFQGLAYLGVGVGVGIRADPSTGSLGPVLAWQGRSLLVRTCHTVHPVLGVTHRISLGFGNGEVAPW